jgi:TorA maturation chaperone TorD
MLLGLACAHEEGGRKVNALEPAVDLQLAATRPGLYRFLLAALDKPSLEQHVWFCSPDFRNSLQLVCASFGLAGPEGDLGAAGPADHEARYLACFEVGLPTPPVVLLASHYNRREPVTAIIHEHLLFYHRFGVRLANPNAEPADHLLHELAFLIHLDELLARGLPARSLLSARRDFLRRQATRWPAQAAAEATEKGLPTVYRALLSILDAAVEEDLHLTEAALAHLPQENP